MHDLLFISEVARAAIVREQCQLVSRRELLQ